MKSIIQKSIILFLFVFTFCSLSAQVLADVEGDVKIRGKIDFMKSDLDSSIIIGHLAGINDDGSNWNTFVGSKAGRANTSGSFNDFYGRAAGFRNVTGSNNAFYGLNAGFNNISGFRNTFFGRASGFGITTGFKNAYYGQAAGFKYNNTRTTLLGFEAETLDSLDRAIAIGHDAEVACHNCAVIGGTGVNAVKVGIGMTTPTETLDVNGKIAITQSAGQEMVIINDDEYNHSTGIQDFGSGGGHFIMASEEGRSESGGIYGDGDLVTIWSPGDGNGAASQALLAVLDEDGWGADDTDPYNNGALKWYLTATGGWIASDINRKANVRSFSKRN